MEIYSKNTGALTERDMESFSRLVQPDRVHRSLYADPAIFELEMDRIFGHAWIYVGHESQIPNPGDYVTALVGRHKMILVRHSDGSPRVLHNRCGHRGALIVPASSKGNVRFFRCCYHGWTFRTDGEVLSIPVRRGYDDTGFDARNPAYWMPRAPRVESYRGFIFANLSVEGPSLGEWLGGVASSLDDFVDRAPAGRIEVAGRPFRVLQRNNWKLFFENLNDAMHALVVHESSVDAARAALARMTDRETPAHSYADDVIPTMDKNGAPYSMWEQITTRTYDWGHSFLGGFFNPDSYEKTYVEALERAYGKERMTEILSVNRHNSIIYPTCSTQAAYQQLRVIRPLSVDRTMIEIYNFRLIGAPDDTYRRTLIFSNLTNSPSSIVMPDDLEAYNRVQEGLSSGGGEWVSFHRDLGRDRIHDGYTEAFGTSELPMRNQYRAWLRYMSPEEA
jgi:phenylpropionate dioxygenase-like ring-hydroxylating dioxygenase large terminal subunit